MNIFQIINENSNAINSINTFVVAIFTLLLFIATFLLWRSTRKLVLGAESTAERQLRAYVTVVGGGISTVHLREGGIGLQVTVELRNASQTPAYRFSTWIKPPEILPNDAVPYGLPASLEERTGFSIVGPGGSAHITYVIPLTDVASLVSKNKRLFVHGGADYQDAFGKDRTFIFRSVSGEPMCLVSGTGDPVLQGMPLQPHRSGYDAS